MPTPLSPSGARGIAWAIFALIDDIPARRPCSPRYTAVILIAASVACSSPNPEGESAREAPGLTVATTWANGPEPTSVLVVGSAVYISHAGPGLATGWIGGYGPDGLLVDTFAVRVPRPNGLCATREHLHVAHGGGLTSYRLADGAVAGRADSPPSAAGYASVTPAPRGTVFVASASVGRVWRLDPLVGATTAVPIVSLPAVTGVAYDESSDRLYLATGTRDGELGRLWTLDGGAEEVQPLGSIRGDFTSIVLREGRLYCSMVGSADGRGSVTVVAVEGHPARVIPELANVSRPGAVDLLGGSLLFTPEGGADRVSVVRFSPTDLRPRTAQ